MQARIFLLPDTSDFLFFLKDEETLMTRADGSAGASPQQHFLDPVCGMNVTPLSPNSAVHEGKTYYFCAAHCKKKFLADPEKYLKSGTTVRAEPTEKRSHSRASFTCPMHPEIHADRPGDCPLCGMALEAIHGEESAAEDSGLFDIRRRFFLSLVFTLPLIGLSMGSMLLPGVAENRTLASLQPWIELLLATPVVFAGGAPFFRRAVGSLRSGHLNMFTLISTGVGAAYAYSLVTVLFPALIPTRMHGGAMKADLYFESAAVIVTLVLLGQLLEFKARKKTAEAVRSLLQLSPEFALRIHADGSEERIDLEDIRPGDILRIKPGMSIPADGRVEDGASIVDESMLSGEPLPVRKTSGDSIVSGSLNGDGSFLMKAEKRAGDSLLARIISLVEKAQRSRAKIQQLTDRASAIFVPLVILAALLTFCVWYFVGPEPVLSHAVVSAIAVLIIACPCALGLAAPVSILVGTGRAAQLGVLVRDAEMLEAMAAVDTLAIDKTGTLTEGKPAVTALEVFGTLTPETALAYAAGLETHSEHPLAAAVVAEAHKRGVQLAACRHFKNLPGRGVSGEIEGKEVRIGKEDSSDALTALPADISAGIETLRASGAGVFFLFVDDAPQAFIAVSDPIKAGTRAALDKLRSEGIQIVMLTGDNRRTAEAVAAQLGIEKIYAGVSPEEKYSIVRELQSQGRLVAMAGDGINDAAALAQAQVGIAMGTGTDTALQSAGITLLKGDLRGIDHARLLSSAIMKNIRQNLFFAFIYNLLGIPLAAGLLFPAFGLQLNPMFAAAAMSLSSVSVIANALRLQRLTIT
jgi:Cu+-exporting ATPase